MRYCDAVMMIPESLVHQRKHRCPLSTFMENCGWSQYPLQHYWGFGYHSHSVVKIMNSLPCQMTMRLKMLSDTLHCITDDTALRLKKMYFTESIMHGCVAQENVWQLAQMKESWDEDEVYGLIQMDFDPELQTRDNIIANNRASHFWGLSKDHFLDRFLQNQLPMQMTEVDWARSFSMYVSRFFDCSVVQYLRFTLGVGKAARSSLVCMTTLKDFNQFGRITKARPRCPVNLWNALIFFR